MQPDDVRNRLGPVFRSVFDDETIQINDDMTARDVEEWDSLNHINLIVAIEKDFSVKFTTREVTSLKDVGELVRLLVAKTT